MVRTLAGDLAALDGIQVVVSRDPRLEPLPPPIIMERPPASGDVWRFWRRRIEEADAVWPVAPETGGLLERLSRLVLDCGRVLLSSRPEAVRIAASKRTTVLHLHRRGVSVAPVWSAREELPESPTGWVVKPDDGAGCEDTRLFCDRQTLESWLDAGQRRDGYVVQPYLPGVPASLSLLCREGEARLLACNRQLIELNDGVFRYRGSVVNGLRDTDGALAALARAVAAALPGLWGHAGVDLVLAESGPVLLEVNPRLTTSYAGLRASLGVNPARLALDLLDAPAGAMAARLGSKTVRVDVEGRSHGR